MNEASKTIALLTAIERSLLRGKGIDIGCGSHPITETCQKFDIEDGDANRITTYVTDLGTFDYVASVHSLEHMTSPEESLRDWWLLLKPGGVLLLVVPDEDLYEQGYWPSIFNSNHTFTFTIAKDRSWSPVSLNLLDLVRILPGAEVLSIRLQDHGYDRRLLSHASWSRRWASLSSYLMLRVPVQARFRNWLLRTCLIALRLPIDQTLGQACAQILVLLRKSSHPIVTPAPTR